MNSVLEITVYDETKECRYVFLGRLAVPLLNIMSGQRKWVRLKDKSLRKRAKGDDPQILLELNIFWNYVRASLQTLEPAALKYEDRTDTKFRFATFNRNIVRIKKAATPAFNVDLGIKEAEKIINWEDKRKSFAVLLLYNLFIWMFEPWMITSILLLPFLYCIIARQHSSSSETSRPRAEISTNDDDYQEQLEDEIEQEEARNDDAKKMSLKKRLQAVEDIFQIIQGYLGSLACLLESLKNLFNFSVPFISWLAVSLIIIVTVILYLVPLRLLVMFWGTEKLTKRFISPGALFNNEIGNLITKVPDNEMIKDYQEILESEKSKNT